MLAETEVIEVIDSFKGCAGAVDKEVEKAVGTEVEATFVDDPISLEDGFGRAVLNGTGILGVRIVETDGALALMDWVLILNEGSGVNAGNSALLDDSGKVGSSRVGKVRDAVREKDSSTDKVEETLPSSDDVASGMEGVGRLERPGTFSTDVAMLSIAEVIGVTIGGTMLGISVALDVSVSVALAKLEGDVVSLSAVVAKKLLLVALDTKTSPAGALFAGLVATRGGKVVNSFGRTRSDVGTSVFPSVVVVAVAAVRSVEVDALVMESVASLWLTNVDEAPFNTALSLTVRLCSQMP